MSQYISSMEQSDSNAKNDMNINDSNEKTSTPVLSDATPHRKTSASGTTLVDNTLKSRMKQSSLNEELETHKQFSSLLSISSNTSKKSKNSSHNLTSKLPSGASNILASIKNTTLSASKILSMPKSPSQSPTTQQKNKRKKKPIDLETNIVLEKNSNDFYNYEEDEDDEDDDEGDDDEDEDEEDDEDNHEQTKLKRKEKHSKLVQNLNRLSSGNFGNSNQPKASNTQTVRIKITKNSDLYEDIDEYEGDDVDNMDSFHGDLDETLFYKDTNKSHGKHSSHHDSNENDRHTRKPSLDNMTSIQTKNTTECNDDGKIIRSESVNQTDAKETTVTSNFQIPKLSTHLSVNSSSFKKVNRDNSTSRQSVTFSDGALKGKACTESVVDESVKMDERSLALANTNNKISSVREEKPSEFVIDVEKSYLNYSVNEMSVSNEQHRLNSHNGSESMALNLYSSFASSNSNTNGYASSPSVYLENRQLFPQQPVRLLNKSMTKGSKAMRVMGNNTALLPNGLLKNATSTGALSSKSGSSLNKGFAGRKLQQKRLFFKNGNINISRCNIDKRRRRYLTDIFTTLIDLKWRYNVLVFALGFFISWIIFAIAWYLISYVHGDLNPIHANHTSCISGIQSFAGALLFSIETQQTIGYGARFTTEKCPDAIFVMMIQSSIGVMIQSFMVGVVFAKLSRPKKRSETLMFSKNAVISLRDGRLCLICRVGDMRKSHIVEAHVRMYLIKKKVTMEGEILPLHMYDLNVGWDKGLDRLFLVWPLTIEHYIDENSPFWTLSADDLRKERFELAVILEGIVER
jgi:potassium inwardly-rectifying channel subfamily J